jgi:hypothetical protein
MPASKLNYLVVYKNHSQVYGCSSKKIAVESPPPEGFNESDKQILFISVEPDSDNLCVYLVDNTLEEKQEKKDKGKKSKQND